MSEQTSRKVPQIRFKGFEGEWEQKTLGELGRVAMNKRVFKHQTSETGEIPFYKIGTFGKEADSFISRKLFNEYKNKFPYPHKGDLLISASGSIGRIVEYSGKDEYFQDSNIVWLQHDGAVVNAFLKQLYSFVEWAGLEGSTIKRLYNKNILETRIVLPKENEQTKIGEYFRELDSLIGLHQRKHDKLVTLKKAMLQKMFPQPGATTPEIRFKGFEGAWVEKTLAEISEIKTGPFGSALHAKDYVSDGVPIITTEHFKYWQLPETKEGLPQVSNSDYERLKNYVLKHGDIVFSRVGSIDINAHVEEKQNGWLFSGRVLRVRTPLSIYSEYLHHELSTDRVRKSVVERAVGQTMPSINTGILVRTAVFLPERKAEQQKIGAYFRTLDELITQHATQLQKLRQIKSACLERMFV